MYHSYESDSDEDMLPYDYDDSDDGLPFPHFLTTIVHRIAYNDSDEEENDDVHNDDRETGHPQLEKITVTLPDSAIYRIFHFVRDRNTFGAAMRTCKRWYELLATEESYKQRLANEFCRYYYSSVYDAQRGYISKRIAFPEGEELDRKLQRYTEPFPAIYSTWREKYTIATRNARYRCGFCGDRLHIVKIHDLNMYICDPCKKSELVSDRHMNHMYCLSDSEIASPEIRNLMFFVNRYASERYILRRSMEMWFDKQFSGKGKAELKRRKEEVEKRSLAFVNSFAQKEKQFRDTLREVMTKRNKMIAKERIFTPEMIENVVNSQPIDIEWIEAPDSKKTFKNQRITRIVSPIVKYMEKKFALRKQVLKMLKLQNIEELDQTLWIELQKRFHERFGRPGDESTHRELQDFVEFTVRNEVLYFHRKKLLHELLEKELTTVSNGCYASVDDLPPLSRNATLEFVSSLHSKGPCLHSSNRVIESRNDALIALSDHTLYGMNEEEIKSNNSEFVKKTLQMAEIEERLAEELKKQGFNYRYCTIPVSVKNFVNGNSDLTFYQALRELYKCVVSMSRNSVYYSTQDEKNIGNIMNNLTAKERSHVFKKLVERVFGPVEDIIQDDSKYVDLDNEPQEQSAPKNKRKKTMSAKKRGKQPMRNTKSSRADKAKDDENDEEKLANDKRKSLMNLFEKTLVRTLCSSSAVDLGFKRTVLRKMAHQQTEEDWQKWENGVELHLEQEQEQQQQQQTVPDAEEEEPSLETQQDEEQHTTKTLARRGRPKKKKAKKEEDEKHKEEDNTKKTSTSKRGRKRTAAMALEEKKKEEETPEERPSLRRSTRVRTKSAKAMEMDK